MKRFRQRISALIDYAGNRLRIWEFLYKLEKWAEKKTEEGTK